MNIDDRLRAASKALRESSVAQVDAASRLREIVRRTGQPVSHGGTAVLDEPEESPRPLAPYLPPAAQPRRTPQRLALAVNLLLVLGLGILLGIAATNVQGADSTTATPTTSTAPSPTASTIVSAQTKVQIQVPDACLHAQELADEVISRLDRNVRDQRLFAALRDYTIASQACRRAASP
jgi:hypothetical protein